MKTSSSNFSPTASVLSGQVRKFGVSISICFTSATSNTRQSAPRSTLERRGVDARRRLAEETLQDLAAHVVRAAPKLAAAARNSGGRHLRRRAPLLVSGSNVYLFLRWPSKPDCVVFRTTRPSIDDSTRARASAMLTEACRSGSERRKPCTCGWAPFRPSTQARAHSTLSRPRGSPIT